MFALCVHDTRINKITGLLERSNDFSYIVAQAMKIYDTHYVDMWSDVVVFECDENNQPDQHKMVGYVAYSLDPRTGFRTRIDPVFAMNPRYRKIYKM